MLFPTSPKIDVVCSDDVVAPLGFTIGCKKFVAHIADALINSGEIAQRVSEDKRRPEAGPAALANLKTFEPKNEPQIVWSSGDVKSTRFAPPYPGPRVLSRRHAGRQRGDRRRRRQRHFAPPRPSSTSAQVETPAKGADVIVHSAIHPVMGPDRDSGMPPPIFNRQSSASDLGAMAKRVTQNISC